MDDISIRLALADDPTLTSATVEGVSTVKSPSGNIVAVLVWFDDEVVIRGLDLGVMLVSLGGIRGTPDTVKEMLAVLEDNGVEDATLVSISPALTVVLKCCVGNLAEASGTAVEIIPATAEVLNKLKLPTDGVVDDKDVILSPVEGSADSLRDIRTVDEVVKEGDSGG